MGAHLAMKGVREVMGRVDPAPSDRPQTHSAHDPHPRPAPPTGRPRGAHKERDPQNRQDPALGFLWSSL